MTNYSKIIAKRIENYLTEKDIKHSFTEKEGVFAFLLSGCDKMKALSFQMSVYETCFEVSATPLFMPTVKNKVQISLFFHVINILDPSVKPGCFDINPIDGLTRYFIHVDCEGAPEMPSREIIENTVRAAASTFNIFWEDIKTVAYSSTCSGKNAIERAMNAIYRLIHDAYVNSSTDDEELEALIERIIKAQHDEYNEDEDEYSDEDYQVYDRRIFLIGGEIYE